MAGLLTLALALVGCYGDSPATGTSAAMHRAVPDAGAHLQPSAAGDTRSDAALAPDPIAIGSALDKHIGAMSARDAAASELNRDPTVGLDAGHSVVDERAPSTPAKPEPRAAQVLCRQRLALSPGDGDSTIGNIYYTWVNTSHANVATDAAGNIVIAGSFVGKINLGGSTLTTKGAEWGLYIAKFDPNCQHLWSHSYGAPSARVEAAPIGIAPDGQISLAGTLIGSVDFGTGRVTARAGQVSGLLLSLRPDGTTRFVQLINSSANAFVYGLGVDPSGDITLTGFGDNNTKLGAFLLNGYGAFIAKFSPAGACLWARSLPSGLERLHLQLTAAGGALIGGLSKHPLVWNDGTPQLVPDGEWLTFISQLEPDGQHRFSHAIEHAGSWGFGYALDPLGVARVAFGLAPNEAPDAEGNTRPDAPTVRVLESIDHDGAIQATANWPSIVGQQGFDVTSDATGALVEIGTLSAALEIGETKLVPPSQNAVYIAKHDSAGNLLWITLEATDRIDTPLGITSDAQGNAVALWFATDTASSAPDELMLVKFAP